MAYGIEVDLLRREEFYLLYLRPLSQRPRIQKFSVESNNRKFGISSRILDYVHKSSVTHTNPHNYDFKLPFWFSACTDLWIN